MLLLPLLSLSTSCVTRCDPARLPAGESGHPESLRCDELAQFLQPSPWSAWHSSPRRHKPQTKPDLSKQPTLYVVGYAHLDTEWRWEYPQVIDEYIRKTMEDNFKLFDKYPHYVFNFSGANRYRFMKEYFPADFARVKKYVDEGQMVPGGFVHGRRRRERAQRRRNHPADSLRQ